MFYTLSFFSFNMFVNKFKELIFILSYRFTPVPEIGNTVFIPIIHANPDLKMSISVREIFRYFVRSF